MSHRHCETVTMKNQTPRSPLVQLELALEAKAGGYDAGQCRRLAEKLSRWAHQLTVKAKVLESHLSRPSRPPPLVKVLSRQNQHPSLN